MRLPLYVQTVAVRALGLVSLTLPSADTAALRQWWADTLGLPAAEDDPTALDLGEVRLRFGPRLALQVVSYDVEAATPVSDPTGTEVVVAPPDRTAAERAEESIRAFVEGAADLPGRPVEDLADEVTAVVLEAEERIRRIVAEQPNDKRLAVHLALGQRARQVEGAPPWHLHAGGTLMSGMFGPGDGA